MKYSGQTPTFSHATSTSAFSQYSFRLRISYPIYAESLTAKSLENHSRCRWLLARSFLGLTLDLNVSRELRSPAPDQRIFLPRTIVQSSGSDHRFLNSSLSWETSIRVLLSVRVCLRECDVVLWRERERTRNKPRLAIFRNGRTEERRPSVTEHGTERGTEDWYLKDTFQEER